MDLEDILLAIDAIKDRLCTLEQREDQKTELEQARSVLAQAKHTLNQINAIRSNIDRVEERLTSELDNIELQRIRFSEAMQYWSEYFSKRTTINFRIDRDGPRNPELQDLSGALQTISINLRGKE